MTSEPALPLERLKLRLATAPSKVVAVLGAGVSIASAPNHADVLSWVGLLKDGSRRCPDTKRDEVAALWLAYEACPEAGRTAMLIAIAQTLVAAFGGQESREFADWLREVLGTIKHDERRADLVYALVDLGVVLVTTNYDTLVEQISDYPTVDVDNGDRAHLERVISGDDKGVIHLHGVWSNPGKIILTWDSYAQTKADNFRQLMLDIAGTGRNLLFIGYGSGMNDPNFSSWTKRMFERFAGTTYDKFMLTTEGASSPPQGIIPLVYGAKGKYAQLPAYLSSLQPPNTRPEQIRRLPRVGQIFGREIELNLLNTVLTGRDSGQIIIYGSAGIGKSSTALKALRHPAVESRFRKRRIYIHCGTVRSFEDLLSKLAYAVDVPGGISSAERKDNVRLGLSREPSVVFLDNMESLADNPEAGDGAEFFALLAGIKNLLLLVGYRGNSIPHYGVEWTREFKISPLPKPHDEEYFSCITGGKFDGQPILRELLDQMQGVPLAIKLIACVAVDESSLDLLFARWTEKKTDLLRTNSGTGADESWAVSLGVSFASPRIRQAERDLLSCLAFFPDGMSRRQMENLLGLTPSAASNVIRLGLVEQKDNIWISMLAPIREHVRIHFPADAGHLRVLTDAIMEFTSRHCSKIGGEHGLAAVHVVSSVISNAEVSIRYALRGENWRVAAEATHRYVAAITLAGIGNERLLEEACVKAESERLRDPNPTLCYLVARLRRGQAKIAERKRDWDHAERICNDVEEDLIPALSGLVRERLEARILKDRADIALARRDSTAGTLYARAKVLLSKPGIGRPRHPIACELGIAAARLIELEIFSDRRSGRFAMVRSTNEALRKILSTRGNKQNASEDNDLSFRLIRGESYQLLSKLSLHEFDGEREALRYLIRALVEYGPTGDIRSCTKCLSDLMSLVVQADKKSALFFEDYISNADLLSTAAADCWERFRTFAQLHTRLAVQATEHSLRVEARLLARFHTIAAEKFGSLAAYNLAGNEADHIQSRLGNLL